MRLYIERWLKAPAQMEDGSVVPRTAGTPQGGVVSPCLANLFLHYAFGDMWMLRGFPTFRSRGHYADDLICHCSGVREGGSGTVERPGGPVLGPASWYCIRRRPKLVYCKDANRRGDYPVQAFDFLGYEFRPRTAVWRDGRLGVSRSSPRRVQRR